MIYDCWLRHFQWDLSQNTFIINYVELSDDTYIKYFKYFFCDNVKLFSLSETLYVFGTVEFKNLDWRIWLHTFKASRYNCHKMVKNVYSYLSIYLYLFFIVGFFSFYN